MNTLIGWVASSSFAPNFTTNRRHELFVKLLQSWTKIQAYSQFYNEIRLQKNRTNIILRATEIYHTPQGSPANSSEKNQPKQKVPKFYHFWKGGEDFSRSAELEKGQEGTLKYGKAKNLQHTLVKKKTISGICNSMKHKYKVGYRSCRIKSFQDMYQRLTYKESTQPLAKTATPTLSAYGTTSGHKRLQYRNIFWRIRRKYEDAQ